MVSLDNVTGGAPFGPSVSAPMIDAGGNVWFLSAVELFDGMGGSQFNNALLRGVYDPAIFGFELELVLKLGDAFAGQNSGRNWLISFMSIADNNSVDSGTLWSQNISESAHNGIDPSGLLPSDPRTLGGLALMASIVYDADGDGDFQRPCDGTPLNEDEDYNVVLYLGATVPSLPAPGAGNDTCFNVSTNTGVGCSTNDDCPAGQSCGLKSRYITVRPNDAAVAGGAPTAIQVRILSMPQYPDREGEIWWAQPEQSVANPPFAALRGAQLACTATPATDVWTNGDLHLFGPPIAPGSRFEVRVCQSASGPCSAPHIVATGNWGDVLSPFGGSGQPDFRDISALVTKFVASPESEDTPRTDIAGTSMSADSPNQVNDFSDIGACVAAFQGQSFPAIVPACP